jgi:hypothetical protein
MSRPGVDGLFPGRYEQRRSGGESLQNQVGRLVTELRRCHGLISVAWGGEEAAGKKAKQRMMNPDERDVTAADRARAPQDIHHAIYDE